MTTTTHQSITPELRQWIVDQARAGHRPETVLEAMKSSGWREDVALEAMETVLGALLKDPVDRPMLPPPHRVPEPGGLGAARLDAVAELAGFGEFVQEPRPAPSAFGVRLRRRHTRPGLAGGFGGLGVAVRQVRHRRPAAGRSW